MTGRFRVKVYENLWDEEPIESMVVSARDHEAAVAVVLRRLRVFCADWVRVEQQGGCRSVMRFLDCRLTWGGSLEFETFFRG